MLIFFQRIPLLIELLFNGSFILLYCLKKYNKIPPQWDMHWVAQILEMAARTIPFVLFFTVIVNYLALGRVAAFFRKHILSVIVLVPLVITWSDLEFTFWLTSIHLLSSLLGLYESD